MGSKSRWSIVLRRRLIACVMAALGIVAGVHGAMAKTGPEGVATHSSRPPSADDEAATLKRIEEKLERLTEAQAELSKRMDQVLEELKIVKIRATLSR